MKRIQIDDDIQQFLVSHAVDLGETASSILRRELHLAPPAGTIEIEDDVYQFLVSKAVSLGESASSILRRELDLGGDQGHAPSIVEFHIPAGTAGQAWNTREVAVVATVGDTLRIVNNDSVPHRLHTAGVPFPHPGSDILPGQSADFVLAAPFDPAADGSLFDHSFGPAAQFWIHVQAVRQVPIGPAPAPSYTSGICGFVYNERGECPRCKLTVEEGETDGATGGGEILEQVKALLDDLGGDTSPNQSD